MVKNIDFVKLSQVIGYEPYTQEFDQVRHITEIVDPKDIEGIHDLMTELRGSDRKIIVDFSKAVEGAAERIAEQFAQAGVDPAETTVTLLIDGSGSTRGRPAINLALSTIETAIALEKLGVETSVLGYSTTTWKGGKSREKWVADGKPANPGRLCDLLYIVYKEPGETVAQALPALTAMIADSTKKENVDGEALMWAAECMNKFQRPNKILVNVTDGFWPTDDTTLIQNSSSYLIGHLLTVANKIEADGKIALAGVYAGLNSLHRKACLDLKEKGQTIFPRDVVTEERVELVDVFAAVSEGLALGIKRAAEIKADVRADVAPVDIDAVELLETYGFEKLDNGIWRFTKTFEGHPNLVDGEDDKVVMIVEEKPDGSFVGHVPFAELQTLDLAGVPEKSLFFATRDPRDMVALAQNEVASAYSQNTGMFPDDGFMDNDDDIFITMPFMSAQYFDYGVTPSAKRTDQHIELLSPATVYDEYAAWRDEFCAKLVAKPTASL